jgi:hypothetical protein
MADARVFNRAFTRLFLPKLRAMGFDGSLPDFCRRDERGAALVYVQKDKYGGGFRIEIGFMPQWFFDVKALGTSRAPTVAAVPDHRLRHVLTKGFERYGELAPEAVDALVARVADRFEAKAPPWFDAGAATKLVERDEAEYRALMSLVGKLAWPVSWLADQGKSASCASYVRGHLKGDKPTKILASWVLAKAGDRDAHAFLVEMLDDPDVTTRTSYLPGESIRAAQALADVHGWPFSWGKPSVARIKQRIAGSTC